MFTTVKLLRLLNGDIQDDNAKLIGCNLSTYNRKENGKSEFTLKELKILAEKYNVKLEKIINVSCVKKEILSVLQN